MAHCLGAFICGRWQFGMNETSTPLERINVLSVMFVQIDLDDKFGIIFHWLEWKSTDLWVTNFADRMLKTWRFSTHDTDQYLLCSSIGHQGWVQWAPSQYKDCLSRYGYSQIKDKTVSWPSYIQHGNPYTGKTTSLYWDSLLDPELVVD